MRPGFWLALLGAVVLAGCAKPIPRHEGSSYGVSRDGSVVFYCTGNAAKNELWMVAGDGQARRIATGGYFECPALSPDGKSLLVSFGRDFKSKLRVHRIDLESWKAEPWGPTPQGSQASPSFSPDGQFVAFRVGKEPRAKRNEGTFWHKEDLWVARADGSEARQVTTAAFDQITAPQWSASGEQIAFSYRDQDGRMWLWEVAVETGKPVREEPLMNNESMPVYVGDRLVIVSDRRTFGKYRLAYLDEEARLMPITSEGYYLEPRAALGKLFALEDVAHKMRFRIVEIDLKTGKSTERVPESAFDEARASD